MKPPMCKLCQKAHWLDADHDTSALEDVRALGASVLRKPVTKLRDEKNNVTPVTKPHAPLQGMADDDSTQYISRGRPKKYKDAAARQRAYRERSNK